MLRAPFVKSCIQLYGLPYLWGGKGYSGEAYSGRDCSGFVTERLAHVGGPDLREFWNTAKMWAELPHVDASQIRPGDLMLWGDDAGYPHHVMVSFGLGGLCIGSAGGDSTTITLAEAQKHHACVQVWADLPNSSGFRFLGYVRLPWLDAAT